MNGEDLVYDYQFHVVDEPSEWAFNWEYTECGTPTPTPRENRATMWMVQNVSDPVWNVERLFKKLGKGKHCPVKLEVESDSSSEVGGVPSYRLTVRHKKTNDVVMDGRMSIPTPDTPDPNVGTYSIFRTKTKFGLTVFRTIWDTTVHGTVAFVEHKKFEIKLDGDYHVTIVTGDGPEDETEDFERLSTRFTLFYMDEEVARCHMSYRDGSYDPSIGPTIEMIAVKQSHRGKGLANVLWHWVLYYINNNFTLECANNDVRPGHVMIKATQIMTQEVERRERKRTGGLWPVGFKEYLFDYCGFSVRIQKGLMSHMFGSRRPKDEEGVLYVPLLQKHKIPTKMALEKKACPKPGVTIMRSKCGTRACLWCGKTGLSLVRCTRCETSFYCNAQCQKNDWTRHKKWCGKTRKQVRKKLIEEGGMVENEDGTYSLVLGPRGQMGL